MWRAASALIPNNSVGGGTTGLLIAEGRWIFMSPLQPRGVDASFDAQKRIQSAAVNAKHRGLKNSDLLSLAAMH